MSTGVPDDCRRGLLARSRQRRGRGAPAEPRPGPSRPPAAAEQGQRVGQLPVDQQFVVEVRRRSSGPCCRPGRSPVPFDHAFARAHRERRQVRVARDEPQPVVDDHHVAVVAVPAGRLDRAVAGGVAPGLPGRPRCRSRCGAPGRRPNGSSRMPKVADSGPRAGQIDGVSVQQFGAAVVVLPVSCRSGPPGGRALRAAGRTCCRETRATGRRASCRTAERLVPPPIARVLTPTGSLARARAESGSSFAFSVSSLIALWTPSTWPVSWPSSSTGSSGSRSPEWRRLRGGPHLRQGAPAGTETDQHGQAEQHGDHRQRRTKADGESPHDARGAVRDDDGVASRLHVAVAPGEMFDRRRCLNQPVQNAEPSDKGPTVAQEPPCSQRGNFRQENKRRSTTRRRPLREVGSEARKRTAVPACDGLGQSTGGSLPAGRR